MTQFFIGVAAPRCGSTWLWRQFKRCPNVQTGKPKELGWFVPNNKHGIEGPRDYMRRLGVPADGPEPDVLYHEFTPGYVEATPEAFSRMDALMPGVKLIAVLRHPVERALSHARFIARQLDDGPRWEDAMSDRVLRRGRYGAFLSNVAAAGLRDRLHVTTTERLFDNPEKEFGALCAHVGAQMGSLKMESVNRTRPAEAPKSVRARLRERLRPEIEVWREINARRHG